MNKNFKGSTVADFNGLIEFKHLKAPVPASLERARFHIMQLIQDGEPNNNSISEDDRKIIAANQKAHFLFSIEHSMECLPGYATLDHKHVKDISDFTRRIEEYVNDEASSQPMNFVIIASPGEGKSYFVDCVANTAKLKDTVEVVLFNMASMRGPDDLAAAVDRTRNVTVKGKLPLLFLDEFDCSPNHYALLLPLLWDGKIALGDRRLEIGRAIIVLAGSTPEVPRALKQAASVEEEKLDLEHPKLVDLVSRINGGVLEIPSLNDFDDQRDRRVDKVCVAIALLRRKYGKGLMSVPSRLLRFIHQIRFKHGVRSIRHLVECLGNTKIGEDGQLELVVDTEGVLDIGRLEEIFKTSGGIASAGLSYHLFPPRSGGPGIKETWNQTRQPEGIVPVWCEAFNRVSRPTNWTDKTAGLGAWLMFRELKNEPNDGDTLDVTAYAGIEPLHLTQLWLSPELGEWNHGNKDMRHVFFNLSTLQQLMLEIINKSDCPTDIGRRMGNGFGKDFVAFLPTIDEPMDTMNQVIDHWCTFDVSGGWGKWDHAPGDHEHTGQLFVRNNFLAERIPGRPDLAPGEKSPFCLIMEGYIRGVLEEIVKAFYTGIECVVGIEDQGCGYPNPKANPCIFKYTLTFKN